MDFQEYKKSLKMWAFEQTPVFIMGPERSGTSLLFQQVSNHPDFCDFSHATVETFSFVKPWVLLEEASANNYEMRVYLGAKNFTDYQKSIQPLIERNNRLSSQGLPLSYLNEENRRLIWYERRYKHILRAFYFHSWEHLGKKRLVEKTPAHIRCAEEIFETFPNAKLLICTREPSEIIASHKKRYRKEVELGKKPNDPSLAWLAHSTGDYLKYFASIDNKISRLFEENGENVVVVPYGQLTTNPKKTLEKIFSFLGVNFVESFDKEVKRDVQAWDPLLNKSPQKNHIDVESYLNKDEINMVSQFFLKNTWI